MDLLESAHNKEYLKLTTPDLLALYKQSEQFIKHQRLQVYENDWFDLVEQHFFLSLLTGNDVQVKQMLKLLIDKFSKDSSRVKKLLTAQAVATQNTSNFNEFCKEINDVDFDSRKISFVPLKTSKNYKEYLKKLIQYVEEDNPVDAEAWSELAEVYAELGDFDSAISSLEQVLIIKPNAHFVFARIAELKKLQAALLISSNFNKSKELILEAVKYASRSVELNNDFVRGWCGVLVLTEMCVGHDKLNLLARKELKRLGGEGEMVLKMYE